MAEDMYGRCLSIGDTVVVAGSSTEFTISDIYIGFGEEVVDISPIDGVVNKTFISIGENLIKVS